ncbi:MAG: hypothetical protein JXD22_11085 [Sedimentisphaerales bacterium]|nr:hypothetical protein [Sedimentisphaerales bacterium]
MKSKITQLAVAAVIVIVVLVSINHFGGSIDGTSTAWADVLEQIYDARTVIYKQTYETVRGTFTTDNMLMEPGLKRTELPHGGIIIFDFSAGAEMQLMPQVKRALINQRIGRQQTAGIHNRLEWLKRLHEQDTEFVGKEEINGVMANVFVCEIPYERTTVWVDTETNLPIKVKMENFPNTTDTDSAGAIVTPQLTLSMEDFGGDPGMSSTITISSARGSGKGIQDKITITYHDFVWGAELDVSLFSMVPPEGYSVKEQAFDDSEPVEDNLVYGLGFWSEMSEGIFPEVINDLGEPNKLKPMLIAKFDKDGDPEEELDAAMDEVHKILKGLYFVQDKKVDGTWGYAGQGVMRGQSEKIICWWFDKKTGCYKAIFGDLTIEDVAKDQLPLQP